jgi:hypothetical protein
MFSKIKNTIYFKIIIITTVYIGVLIVISPIVDNLFRSLEEDKEKKENKIQIFFEIIFQLILVSILWYHLHNLLRTTIEKILNLQIKSPTENTISFISSIALIGLQKNLLDKLEYITDVHPFS